VRELSAKVSLVSTDPARFTPVPNHQLDILKRLTLTGIEIKTSDQLSSQPAPDLIIVGVIGNWLQFERLTANHGCDSYSMGKCKQCTCVEH
jgi:hypothetical protein